MFRIA
jgi:hypothetical protein